jgi:phage host-nuclease inhibitor protein Gam
MTAAAGAAPKVLATVDGVLADIARARTVLAMREAVLANEIEQIKEKYREPIEAAKTELDLLEAELRGLCERHDEEIFGAGDQVDLPAGILVKESGRKIRWPRGPRLRAVIAAIAARGWHRLLRRPEPTVAREEVEKLDDATVADLGLERVPYVEFNWELKGV